MRYLTILLSTLLPLMTQASPLTLRDVYDPPITSPDAQTVWSTCQVVTVTWDISSLPPNLTSTGMLVLGFETTGSENLMLDNPLATNFLLTDAKVQITVPNVPTRSNYIVVLFGDSGNASPQFTITNTSSSTACEPPTASPTTSPTTSATTDPSTQSPTTTAVAAPQLTVTMSALPSPSSSTSTQTSPSSLHSPTAAAQASSATGAALTIRRTDYSKAFIFTIMTWILLEIA